MDRFFDNFANSIFQNHRAFHQEAMNFHNSVHESFVRDVSGTRGNRKSLDVDFVPSSRNNFNRHSSRISNGRSLNTRMFSHNRITKGTAGTSNSSSNSMNLRKKLFENWYQRTDTPLKGTFNMKGDKAAIENGGGKYFIVTHEGSGLNIGKGGSFDFELSVKSCSKTKAIKKRYQIHIILGFKNCYNFISIVGDISKSEWRVEKISNSSLIPSLIANTKDLNLKVDKFFELEISVRDGELLTITCDGTAIFKNIHIDQMYIAGPCGFACQRSKMLIKNVSLKVLDSGSPISEIEKEKTKQSKVNSFRSSHFHPQPFDDEFKDDDKKDKVNQDILKDLIEDVSEVSWEDIAGLDNAKRILKEAIILPVLRPDLFKGLRAPPKGVLLFGPPGTGKTMLAKCVAHESKASFFCITASSLTSKFHGEGEKTVRALFENARKLQPSVIFIDEIDGLLSARRSQEHDAVRRLKTEFLLQFDGLRNKDSDRILLMGATNLPFELDDALIRRLTKRIYIPLPDASAKRYLIHRILDSSSMKHNLTESDVSYIHDRTENYSGSDLSNLCREAAFGPVRDLGDDILKASENDMRPIRLEDFESALNVIRPSVSISKIDMYERWNDQYGVRVINKEDKADKVDCKVDEID